MSAWVPLCAKNRLVSLHGVHKVRASTKQVAGLMYGYPEVLCGTMVARQIFDELPMLPAPITCGAGPVDNPVENCTKRKRLGVQPMLCPSQSANGKTCETPKLIWGDLSLLVPLPPPDSCPTMRGYAYCASPLPNDQFSLATSKRLRKMSCGRSPGFLRSRSTMRP